MFRIMHDKISVLVNIYLPATNTIFRAQIWCKLPSAWEERCAWFIKWWLLQIWRKGQGGASLLGANESETETFCERSEQKHFRKSGPVWLKAELLQKFPLSCKYSALAPKPVPSSLPAVTGVRNISPEDAIIFMNFPAHQISELTRERIFTGECKSFGEALIVWGTLFSN